MSLQESFYNSNEQTDKHTRACTSPDIYERINSNSYFYIFLYIYTFKLMSFEKGMNLSLLSITYA